jgi:hypothetical protein
MPVMVGNERKQVPRAVLVAYNGLSGRPYPLLAMFKKGQQHQHHYTLTNDGVIVAKIVSDHVGGNVLLPTLRVCLAYFGQITSREDSLEILLQRYLHFSIYFSIYFSVPFSPTLFIGLSSSSGFPK